MSGKQLKNYQDTNIRIDNINHLNNLTIPILNDDTNLDIWLICTKKELDKVHAHCLVDERKSTLNQIKKVIEKRHNFLISDQRVMISSLQDIRKNSITLDQVATKDAQRNTYITTNPSEIMYKIDTHYTEIFKRRKADFNLLSESFKKEYEPKIEVNDNIYQNLSDL